MTQGEVAEHFGVSKQAVDQAETRAIRWIWRQQVTTDRNLLKGREQTMRTAERAALKGGS